LCDRQFPFKRPLTSQYARLNAFCCPQFGYHTGQGDKDNSFREEQRLPDGTVKGAYGYVDASGKKHIVKYTAGKDGFKVEGDVNAEIAAASQATHPPPEAAPTTVAPPRYQPQASPAYNTAPAQPSYQPQPQAYQPQASYPASGYQQQAANAYQPSQAYTGGYTPAARPASVGPAPSAYGSYNPSASAGTLASSASANLPTRAIQPKLSAPVQYLSRPAPPLPQYSSSDSNPVAIPISSAARYNAARSRSIHASASSSQPTYSLQAAAAAAAAAAVPKPAQRRFERPQVITASASAPTPAASTAVAPQAASGPLGFVSVAMRSFMDRVKA
jgi:hypothetical protein